jgi:hypothetical protein
VQDATWQAFWRTAVDGASPQEVAEDLHIRVTAVYLAKSRTWPKSRNISSTAPWNEERSEHGRQGTLPRPLRSQTIA